jgi:hypothetical protein
VVPEDDKRTRPHRAGSDQASHECKNDTKEKAEPDWQAKKGFLDMDWTGKHLEVGGASGAQMFQ